MALDRDLAVALVGARFASARGTLRGWETTAATGIRGLRLLHETGRFASFRLSEASDRSFEVLRANCADHPGAIAVAEDARRARSVPGAPFDYVDVDPYGSPLPFLGAALGAARSGGVLAVTATDMMVLAGAQPAATRRLYGAEPVRGRLGPEGGLRILLARLAREARAAQLEARPLLAYVGEHHVRAYVALVPASGTPDPVGTVDRASFQGPSLGTGRPVGPLWLGPLFDRELLGHLELPPTAQAPRQLARLLELFRGEAEVRCPFFYESNTLASSLHLPRPPGRERLRRALAQKGFAAARTHVRPEGFRTDAPRDLVERVARELVSAG